MICSTHSRLGIKLIIFHLLRSAILLPPSFPIVSVAQSRGGYILRLTKQLRHGPGMYREYHWPRAAGQSHVCWYLPGETARPTGTRDSGETGLRCHWKRIVIMMPTSLWGCHMSVMAYHSTDNSTVWSTACSGRRQTKHQNSRIPGDRWIPLTKSQKCGKCFYVMKSLVTLKFVMTKWRQSWHHDSSRFSMLVILSQQPSASASQPTTLPFYA